jgi:hypothetical protein
VANLAGASESTVHAALQRRVGAGRVSAGPEGFRAIDLPVPALDDRRRAMHRAIGGILPAASTARIRNLLLGGGDGALAEAMSCAEGLLARGLPQRARILLEELRPVAAGPLPERFATLLAEAVLRADSRLDLERGALVLAASHPDLAALLAAALATWEGRASEVAARTANLPRSWLRACVRFDAALRTDLAPAAAEIEDAVAFLGPDHPDPWAWRGHLAYRRCDFAASRAFQDRAARLESRPGPRLNAVCNGAAALLEELAFEAALDRLASARDEAARAGCLAAEAKAQVLWRSARYRAGGLDRADEELVDALDEAGLFRLAPFSALNEAALAWRAGDGAGAHRLALRSARGSDVLGAYEAAHLGRTLAAVALHRPTPPAPRTVGVRNLFRVQADVLTGGRPLTAEERASHRLPADRPEVRLEVLSLGELDGYAD